jgi:hypothetical protein
MTHRFMETRCLARRSLAIAVRAVLAVLVLHAGQGSAQIMYRPAKTYLTMTTEQYAVHVQKSGRFDVIRSSGEPLFMNVFPMAWIEGDKEPRMLPVDGRRSSRVTVKNPLGEGPGMVLARGGVSWALHVYPTKPFMTVELAYQNTGKKPVAIRALYPWAVGLPQKKGLASVAGDGTSLVWIDGLSRETKTTPEGGGAHYVSMLQPATGRVLVAGFLTENRGRASVQFNLANPEAPMFQAVCTYDPPVLLQPGESLVAEPLYVALTESDPLAGMERYAHAVAAHNQRLQTGPVEAHGWTVTPEDLEAVAASVPDPWKRRGWRLLSIRVPDTAMDADAVRAALADPGVVSGLRERGFAIGIQADLFAIDPGSPVATAHPDWFLGGSALTGGRMLPDPTHPDAAAHMRALLREMARVPWQQVNLTTPLDGYALSPGPFHEPGVTGAEAVRRVIAMIRDTLPPGTRMHLNGTSLPVLLGADGFLIEAPDAMNALRILAGSFHWAPYLARPVLLVPPDASPEVARALAVAAGLAGGQVVLPSPDVLPPAGLEQVLYFTANRPFPARPVNLFVPGGPPVWATPPAHGLPVALAIFNPTGAEDAVTPVPLGAPGLRADQYHTVFDVLQEDYTGTLRDALTARVAAGSMRAFLLAPHADRPALLFDSTRGLAGQRPDGGAAWDPASKTLTGTVSGEGGEIVLRYPETLTPLGVHIEGVPVPSIEGPNRSLYARVPAAGPDRTWKALFADAVPGPPVIER